MANIIRSVGRGRSVKGNAYFGIKTYKTTDETTPRYAEKLKTIITTYSLNEYDR